MYAIEINAPDTPSQFLADPAMFALGVCTLFDTAAWLFDTKAAAVNAVADLPAHIHRHAAVCRLDDA